MHSFLQGKDVVVFGEAEVTLSLCSATPEKSINDAEGWALIGGGFGSEEHSCMELIRFLLVR